MGPEIGLAATRLALFLIIAAGLSLLWVSRNSAEFVVLVLTIAVGAAMLGGVALLARLSATGMIRLPRELRQEPKNEADESQ